jgi:plasmid stabilization system protein ParE
LKERRLRFTATARRHVDRERTWWLENRDYQALFATELEAAVGILALLPGAGTSYPQANVMGLRRLYLEKLASHLYYTFNDEAVVIRALWGARRERGPRLR